MSWSQKQHILWSIVARDDVILAEAGEDLRELLAETVELLQRKSRRVRISDTKNQ
jgi:hypothetical protein